MKILNFLLFFPLLFCEISSEVSLSRENYDFVVAQDGSGDAEYKSTEYGAPADTRGNWSYQPNDEEAQKYLVAAETGTGPLMLIKN